MGVLAAASRLRSGTTDRVVLLGRSGRSASVDVGGVVSGIAGVVTAARCDVSAREDASALPIAIVAAASSSSFSSSVNGKHGGGGACPRVELLHAGGTLCDATVGRQNAFSLTTVMAPKVHGAARLRDALACLPTSNAVLFSSVAALLGSTGQSSYVAANACLDGIAAADRSRVGIHAVASNFSCL